MLDQQIAALEQVANVRVSDVSFHGAFDGVEVQGFEPGEHLSASVVGTYRYDAYGLLIEQWTQVELEPACAEVRPVAGVVGA